METVASVLTGVDLENRIENAILRSNVPININETEEISVLGHRGIWANRNEVINWKGPVPISQYRINEDPNPEVIHKTSAQPVEYTQDIQVRYLRPPTPPAPGELIIRQESVPPLPEAPPQVIRQQAPRPITPEPLIIREAPPEPPAAVARKIVTIKAPPMDPPPRKVVIEKLPTLPPKPQPILIERWLPFKDQKRRVVFQPAPVVQHERVKNLVVQWQAPPANIKRNVKYLGVQNTDPREYIAKYGSSLKRANEMPPFVVELEGEFRRVIQEQSPPHELEGDIDALKLVDLEREGLGMYRHYLNSRGFHFNTNGNVTTINTNGLHTSVVQTNAPGRVITEVYASSPNIHYSNGSHQSNTLYNTNFVPSNITQY